MLGDRDNHFQLTTHLEISKLQGGRALRDGGRGLSQRPTSLLLTLSSNHLDFLAGCLFKKEFLTLALASLAASASAAIALCNWTGSLTSLLKWNDNFNRLLIINEF